MELNFELERLQKYAVIEKELIRAEEKHPAFPSDMYEQLAIMQEEAGEVTKAVIDYHCQSGTIQDVKDELIQTAAMCMRMLLNIMAVHPRTDVGDGVLTADGYCVDPECQMVYTYPSWGRDRVPTYCYLRYDEQIKRWQPGTGENTVFFLKRENVDKYIHDVHKSRSNTKKS